MRRSAGVHRIHDAKQRGRLAVAFAAFVVLLGLFATQASAITLYHHPLLGSFGSQGIGKSSKFTKPLSVAVDQGSHDLYVFDFTKEGTNPRQTTLYRFTSAGAPHPFTAGPGAGTHAITFAEPNELPLAGSLAVAPPGSPAGTAGNVYVIVSGKVEVYSPEGAHLGTIDGSGNPNPGGTRPVSVAVDGAGNLYVLYPPDAGSTFSHLDKYVPSANPPKNSDFDSELHFEGTCDAAVGPTALYLCGRVVDPSNGDLYLPKNRGYRYPGLSNPGEGTDLENGVSRYDAAGNWVSFITISPLGVGSVEPQDVALDWSTGHLYISVSPNGAVQNPGEKSVRIYGDGEAVQPPTATIDPVASFDFKSAHFTGTVNTGASGPLQETAYRFFCRPRCPGLQTERNLPGDGADHVVSDDAVELQPATKYEVELIARNVVTTQDLDGRDIESFTAAGYIRARPFPPELGEVVAVGSFETAAKPPANPPEVSVDPVSEFDSESAHLQGTVDPKGTGPLQETTYRFEYSSDGIKWISAGEGGPIDGEGPQAVSANVLGLNPSTTYQVRLQAENDGGEATSALPNPTFTTDAVAPLVEVTHATQAKTGSVQLNGRIDPNNDQTSYYFEWGPADCAANSCTAIPAGKDGDAGAGNGFGWVSAQISGLSPGTSYSYRLLAKNSAGEATSASSSFATETPPGGCPNTDQRVGAAAALPDCRAYEMVSPVDKAGSSVSTTPAKTRVSVDGDAVTFKSNGAFAGASGFPFPGVEYMSVRDAEGWRTRPISPYQQAPFDVVQLAFNGPAYTGLFSPDLETGIFRAFSPIPGVSSGNVAERANIYVASGLRSGEPSFQLVSDSDTPLGRFEDKNPYIAYDDASADFSKVAFETLDNLTAQASGEERKVYEWEEGTVRLAGILPDSACASPPCVAPNSVGGSGALHDIQFTGGSLTDVDNVVSEDGSKVFFSAGGSVYARIDSKTTVQLNASERSIPDPDGSGTAGFGAASADGRLVYFTSKEKLVDEDTDSEASLYRYDFDSPVGQRLTLLSLPGGSGAVDVLGLSRSGEIAYVREGEALFVVRGDEASLVVANIDVPGSGLDTLGDNNGYNAFRVTPDGRYVAFVSRENLVGYGYPNGTTCEYGPSCPQVYLYSFDSDKLTCVSCNFGHVPTGEAFFTGGITGVGIYDQGLRGAQDTNLTRPLSNDGRYLFFSSPEALVPRDSNGQYDVYVYDSEKEEMRLVSSGLCNCKSIFMSASPDGRDVFFTTYERLVRADTDTQADLYDARIGGGIASQNAIPPAQCQGDACQGQPASPPELTPSSAGFAGPGSPPQRKKARHKRKRKHKQGARKAAKHKRAQVKRKGAKQRAGNVRKGGSK